jgi:hypothetical protein
MNRRGFLRSAVAGLLGCAMPAGLLAGETYRVGKAAFTGMARLAKGSTITFGVDLGEPGPMVTVLQSYDNGQTWEVARFDGPDLGETM